MSIAPNGIRVIQREVPRHWLCTPLLCPNLSPVVHELCEWSFERMRDKNCQLSIVNCHLSIVNCQLSIVNGGGPPSLRSWSCPLHWCRFSPSAPSTASATISITPPLRSWRCASASVVGLYCSGCWYSFILIVNCQLLIVNCQRRWFAEFPQSVVASASMLILA